MTKHKLTIHYKGYLITRENLGKYKWRLSEFETEKQAIDAINEHILTRAFRYKINKEQCLNEKPFLDLLKQQPNNNMEQNNFKVTNKVFFLLDSKKQKGEIRRLDDFNKKAAIRFFDDTKGYYNTAYINYGDFEYYKENVTNPKDYAFTATKPKEYEIVSYRDAQSGTIFPVRVYGGSNEINSVRRLSDNTVFSVNDNFSNNGAGIYTEHIIERFEISNDELKVYCKGEDGFYSFENLSKAKQKLFTTTDLVDIYEGDKVVLLDTLKWLIADSIKPCKNMFEGMNGQLKYFSTQEAAEQYINLNANKLSVLDVLRAYPAPRESLLYNELKSNLIELAKSKTKTNE